VGRRISRRSAYRGELEHMFFGRYEHSIDDKGRMTIPVRFREALETGAYITHGFDRNLVVYTTSYLNTLSEKVRGMSNTDPDARLLRRLLFSSAALLEFDKAGRILIPQFLRDTVDIQSNAIVIGVGDYFEIWSPSNWEAQNALLDDSENNIQRFSALNL
jgi:MraZ protein